MNKNGHNGKKGKQTQTHGEGDWIHKVIGHMEHLMDLFEIALAFIVAFGFVVSVIPLLKEVPHLMSHSSGTAEFHEFLENTLTLVIGIEFIKMLIKHTPVTLVIGIEFIKMLIKHTPGSVVEVLLFAIARHAILAGGTALENLLTILSIAVIFAVRKFIFIESFDFLEDGSTVDWLSDWKEIINKGNGDKVEKKAVGETANKAEAKMASEKSTES